MVLPLKRYKADNKKEVGDMMAKSLLKRRRRKLIALSLEVLVRNLNGGHNLTILMLTRSGVPPQSSPPF